MKVAGYVRLSRDDNKEDYISIVAQKDIISNYAKSRGWEIVKFYEDDDVSGYKFDSREGFTQLLQDIQNDKIDVVIAKDLSRIGRHNAYTLLFIENLRSMGKTLIAIDDNYDSSKDNDDIIGIKTWYNERYVKDLSKKIRSNIYSHMKNNKYQNSAPYGYIVDEVTNNLVVDESVRPIIVEIFNLYLNGYGALKIAQILNERKIPTPMEHIKSLAEKKGIYYKRNTSSKWLDTTVLNILKNDVYIGVKRLGKTRRDVVHGKRRFTDEREQFVFENNHEPIIDKEMFYKVQELIQKRKEISYRGSTKHYNPYSGLLFCLDCGTPLVARSQVGRAKFYVCRTYKKFGKQECDSHYIKEDKLNNAVKLYLSQIKITLQDYLSSLDKEINEKLKNLNQYDIAIKKTQDEITALRQEYNILLSQKIKSIAKNPEMEKIIEEQFEELEKEKLQKITALEKQLKELQTIKANTEQLNDNIIKAIDVIDIIINSEQIEKKYLEYLIDKIYVDKYGEPIIKLKGDMESLFLKHREMIREQEYIINLIRAINYLANLCIFIQTTAKKEQKK